jgi:hypothetical protein
MCVRQSTLATVSRQDMPLGRADRAAHFLGSIAGANLICNPGKVAANLSVLELRLLDDMHFDRPVSLDFMST